MKTVNLLSKFFKNRDFNKETNFSLNFLHVMRAIFLFVNE